MGRRNRPVRLPRLMGILACLAIATFLSSPLAISEGPQLVTQAHEEKPFRIDVPLGWNVEWNYPLGPYREADMVAFGPLEGSYRTNVGVYSRWAEAKETDAYLLEAGHGVIEDLRGRNPVTLPRPPMLVDTVTSRAAVFEIVYEAIPVTQVIALVASETQAQVWTIVGTSVLETAERNQPIFQAVIASFTLVADPQPALVGPVGSSAVLGAVAGAVVLLGAWVLYRRRHDFIPLLRAIRDEGRLPGLFEPLHKDGAELPGITEERERPH